MDFESSDKVKLLSEQIERFMDEYIYPAEPVARRQIEESGDPHHEPQVLKELRARAKELGLWNLFLPDEEYGAGLTNAEYAPLCEIMGRSPLAPRAFNCNAPDTGNMEILAEFGTPEQKKQWLEPLLAGETRSCFSMTEPEVSGADPTGLRTRAVRDGDEWVINGHKWFTSGPRARASPS
jgi:acyl-CoA dehydrogenase